MTQPYRLTSSDLTATISPLGARLESLHYQGGSNLVLHSDDPAWRDSYGGTIVGPVANRVAGGHVRIAGETYQMPCNENGITALHSGPDGLDRQIWDVIDQNTQMLRLRYTLADGAGGLPGTRVVEVIYSIEGPCLTLDITAETDGASPISIAHHPYWRLGNANDHRLEVHADTYLPLNDLNLPTGDILPVAGTVFDHRTAQAVDPNIDHNFCISKAQRPTAARVATLRGTDGLTLHIDSTEPGLQVYAGAFLPEMPQAGIRPGAGLALEPQGWPDAINQPGFPTIIVGPDKVYQQQTRYTVTG